MSVYILPLTVGAVLFYGLIKKVPLLEAMTSGVKQGLRTCAAILPPVLVMLTVVRMFEASGGLDTTASLLGRAFSVFGFPAG